MASGSTALLRFAGAAAPELSDAQTYAGAVPLTSSAVRSPASLTVVLLADTLTPASQEDVRKQLLQLPLSLHGMPMRLALLQGGSLSVSAPLGRVRLKAELDKIQPGPDASAAAAGNLITTLAANAVQLGSDWSPVLLVGELPPPDAATSDYAAALLVHAFTSQRLQVSWFAPSGGNDAWLPVFQATGGSLLRDGLREFTIPRGQAAADLAQLDWTPRVPSAGFVLFHSIFTDQQGQKLLDIPDLSAAPGASLPSIEQYSDMRRKTADAAALLSQPPISADNAQRIRDDLQAALNMNPRDPQALATAAEFYERARDYATAATLGGYLVEVRPLDGAAYAAYGHALQLGAELDKAEAALQRASQLGAHTPGISEDFARVHLARKDDQGAIPYLEDVLRSDDKRQDLWFLEGDAADRLLQSEAAIRCFERGLALGGVHVAQSGSLVRLYLAARQEEKASTLARQVIAGLPPEPAPRAEFAAILDDLGRAQEALLAWKRVLEDSHAAENDRPRRPVPLRGPAPRRFSLDRRQSHPRPLQRRPAAGPDRRNRT